MLPTMSDEYECARLCVLKAVKEGAEEAILVPQSRIGIRVQVPVILYRSPSHSSTGREPSHSNSVFDCEEARQGPTRCTTCMRESRG